MSILPLDIQHLRVEYDQVVAVEDFTITLNQGMILGLLGPNGAGKTSVMSSIAGLSTPTRGQIKIQGYSIHSHRSSALAHLGYMPDQPPLYEALTVYEFLELFAAAYGVDKAQRDQRILELLEEVELINKREAQCGELSRGMRQRLFLAKTLLHKPSLLVLDEPNSGLDPIARRSFVDLLRCYADQGHTIILSSHVLTELDDICDSICIMNAGQVLGYGTVEQMRLRLSGTEQVQLRLADGMETEVGQKCIQYLRQHESVIQVDRVRDDLCISMKNDRKCNQENARAELLKSLVLEGFSPSLFAVNEANIEQIFLQLSKVEKS